MKKVILAVLAVSFSIPLPNSSAFDSTPPRVESCTISPRVVSDATGGTVRVTIKVQSNNGLSSNVLSVLNLNNYSTSTLRQLGGFIMNRESGDEFSGTWFQDIAVKPGLMPGLYELSIFPLEDKVQNRTSFLPCPGQDVTYGVATPALTPTPTPSKDAMAEAQQTLAAAKYAFCIAQNSVTASAAKIAGTTPPSAPDCGVDPATVVAPSTPSAVAKNPDTSVTPSTGAKTPDTSATDLIAAFDSVNAKLSAFKDWVLQIKNQFPTHQVAIDMYSSPVFKYGPVNTIAKTESLANLLVTQQSLIENAVKQWEKTAPIKSSLICTKGKIKKKVSGINPKCPVGYKVKK